MIDFLEFRDCFFSLLRDGEDYRVAQIKKMLYYGANELVEWYKEDAGDLAAILSGCLIYHVHSGCKMDYLSNHSDHALLALWQDLGFKDQLPLRAAAHYPDVQQLLDNLLQTPAGAKLYYLIACYLEAAQSQADMRVWLNISSTEEEFEHE